METRLIYQTLITTLVSLSASSVVHATDPSEPITGTFVMMSSENCKNQIADDCYLNSPVKADKVIERLSEIGVKQFLLPSGDLAQLRNLAGPISSRGLKFYTYERWSYEAALHQNSFNCEYFRKNRIESTILPLRNEYPTAFAGLHYKDEPSINDITGLGEMTNCVRSDARVSTLKIFINLLPIHANPSSYAGTSHAGALTPEEYGVNCSAGLINDPDKAAHMVANYSDYARKVSDTVRPNELAFDLYPFVKSLASCPTARDLLLSENMSIVSNIARSRGQLPIAYVQNVQSSPNSSNGDFLYANFHDLRWFSSWFYVFGGSALANFLSHNVSLAPNAPLGGDTIGLLSDKNLPTHLASDQKSLFGFSSQIQSVLWNYDYRGFVDRQLGVDKGVIAGWISTPDLLVGEYENTSTKTAVLVFSRRQPRQSAEGYIGLTSWWSKIEKLELETGRWTVVGSSTNRIDVHLGDFPGAVYRLTM